MQNIRIFTYLFGLLTIVIFEEPRVSQLLALVFPGEFSKIFSYALPVLVLLISVVTYSQGQVWKGRSAVFAFSVVLFLSYGNTVLISVREAQAEHSAKIETVEHRIDQLHIQFAAKRSTRVCWAPEQNAENYQALMAGYNACVAASLAETQGTKQQSEAINQQIKSELLAIEKLRFSWPDYIKSITQASVGILLSVILGIGTAVFCLGLSSEIRDLTSGSEQSDVFRIAGFLAEGRSIREIAQELGISKGTAERTIREFRRVQAENGIGNSRIGTITQDKKSGTAAGQQWDTSGTVWDSHGTEPGQPKKQPKNRNHSKNSETQIESADLGGFFGLDFSGFAGSGRMA